MRLAIQTWMFRSWLKRDLAGTLARIAATGIRHVELAGTVGYAPAVFKAACEASKLFVIGLHESSLQEDSMPDILEEVEFRRNVFGCAHVTTMWDPFQKRTPAAYERFARLCQEAASFLNAKGGILSVHCYPADFLPFPQYPDQSPLDLLLLNTDQLVNIQLDTYFAFKTALPFSRLLEKCKGRCHSIHANEISTSGTQAALGNGIHSWNQVIEEIQRVLTPEWCILEHDTADPFATVRSSITHLKGLTLPHITFDGVHP